MLGSIHALAMAAKNPEQHLGGTLQDEVQWLSCMGRHSFRTESKHSVNHNKIVIDKHIVLLACIPAVQIVYLLLRRLPGRMPPESRAVCV